MNKTCRVCGINKNIDCFYFRKDNNKYRNDCIECNREHTKNWIKNNREKYNISTRKYYYKNQQKYLEYAKEYRNTYNAIDTKRRRIRRKEDPTYRLKCNLRRRLYHAIKKECLPNKKDLLIGCSNQELKKHLESQFTKGMSWDNYGEWHVDHIRPCNSFDLTKKEEQLKCFQYSNLQPLWAYDNMVKGSKWEEEE